MSQFLNNSQVPEEPESDPSLDTLRLRVYKVAFPIGIAVLIFVYIVDFIQGTATQFQLVFHPLIALVTVITALVVVRYPHYLRSAERFGFFFVSIFLALRFYSIVYESIILGSGLIPSTFPQWLPMIYFMAFLMFKERQALFASILFYFLLLVPVLVILITYGVISFKVFDLSTLLQIHLSHAVYIPLLSGITLLKSHYVRAAARAEALAAIATVDYLTGATNRRYSEQQLNKMIDQAQRYTNKLSIILLDIDSFKLINDAHGHSAGDQVLIRLVELLRQHLRASDVCGRWGGEEFIIITPATPLDQAVLLADRLRTVIANETIERVGKFTVSLGVAELQPNETAQAVVKRADQALYRAKQSGRNRVASD